MTVSAKVSEVVQSEGVVAECLTCQWSCGPTGTERYPGTKVLALARTHAAKKKHETIVHRSTSYDGRKKP